MAIILGEHAPTINLLQNELDVDYGSSDVGVKCNVMEYGSRDLLVIVLA